MSDIKFAIYVCTFLTCAFVYIVRMFLMYAYLYHTTVIEGLDVSICLERIYP